MALHQTLFTSLLFTSSLAMFKIIHSKAQFLFQYVLKVQLKIES